MKHIYNDGGRSAAGFKGSADDCVVRAVAIATRQDYLAVYEALGAGCRSQRLTKRSGSRKGSARDGVNVKRQWFKDYMAGLGWRWTPTMGIGTGCKVHLTDGELPMGRLIVAVSKHYTAVIDGVIHDTHSSERNVHSFYCPPGVTSSDDPRTVHTIQRRCVYGWWAKAAS